MFLCDHHLHLIAELKKVLLIERKAWLRCRSRSSPPGAKFPLVVAELSVEIVWSGIVQVIVTVDNGRVTGVYCDVHLRDLVNIVLHNIIGHCLQKLRQNSIPEQIIFEGNLVSVN
uniref:Uncharacterized protein n=1 Tax=Cacopsylla melanoneura TaxID=428564 RepID=A0A8D9E847_9HEMI